MEDFDVFTNEITFTKPQYKNLLNKYVNEVPSTPNIPNYQSGRKLLAEECLAENDDAGCAFQLSEAVSASIRTMAVYREEQLKAAGNKMHKITSFIKPIRDLIDSNSVSKNDKLFDFLSQDMEDITKVLKSYEIDEELPFHMRYLKFSSENNVDNLRRILGELPKEWTVIQITAPYNPYENLKPLNEYRTDIKSLYLTVFTNDYMDEGIGHVTINIPANITKEGEKPLFTELYSLLDDNYKTIDNAQFLNNKRLVQNYWSRREDIDLRMKSVINVMDKDWLGGWGSLLTGRLVDKTLKERVVQLVDNTISDWGFIKLTQKQKFLLYNLIESCPVLSSQQIKSCIRRILTEHGNPDDIKQHHNTSNCVCTKEFKFINDLCLKCLSRCFEAVHHFTLVDGIKAFSQAATQVRDNDEWATLKKAKRHPVILIIDEMLDTFPWETLPILNQHPVSRMENIHFLYYLYKIHEDRVIKGYFAAKADVGRYVINPEKNLDRMEKRMSSFVKYWCESWTGHIGEPPSPADFLKHLTEADIFFPMVVGMLWEVTDLEVDKVVTTLMSLYVPSAASPPWPAVGKSSWSQGELDTTVEPKSQFVPEPNLLRAISRSRGSTNYVMIASSVVARGLPVRIFADS